MRVDGIEPDPERLALFGVTLQQLAAKIRGANMSFQAGRIRMDGDSIVVEAGQTMDGLPDIGLLLLTTRDGRPVDSWQQQTVEFRITG